MSKQVRLRRGTTAQHSSFTGAQGEVTVDTDKKVVVVHDGSTAGGVPMFPSTGGTITGMTAFGAGLKLTGPATLGAAAAKEWSYEHPVTRYYFGDGSGYSFALAKRVGSVTTDVMTVADSGNVTVTGSASASDGFKTTTYTSNARNPIWRFGNSDPFGVSYFQGTSGFGGTDSIGFHFGTATSAASTLNILNEDRGIVVAGQVYAQMHESLNATHRGLKFGISNNTTDFGGVTMEMSTGVVRYTAGYTGWGGSHEWYSNGVLGMQLSGAGSLTNLTGVYGTISDAKLKRDWYTTGPKLNKILAMNIVNYYLKADPTNTKFLGVIAQELREISPGLVEETPDYETVEVQSARTDVVTKTRQAVLTEEIALEEIQLIDGQYRKVQVTKTVEVPQFETVNLYDENGEQLFDEKDNPVTHQIPVMEEYTEEVHYPAVTESRLTGEVTLSVKYSILVSMLVKAMQEMHEDFDQRLKALEK